MVAVAKQERVIPVVNFRPFLDFVLFIELEHGETAGGIALPDDNDVTPPKGLVVAVGPGRASELDPAKRIPMDIKPGMVVYLQGTATKFWLGKQEFGLLRQRDIVAEAPQG